MFENDEPTPPSGYKLSERNRKALAQLREFTEEVGELGSGCLAGDPRPTPKNWWERLKRSLHDLFDIFRS